MSNYRYDLSYDSKAFNALAKSRNIGWLMGQCSKAFEALRHDQNNELKREYYTSAVYFLTEKWFAQKKHNIALGQDPIIDKAVFGSTESSAGLFHRLTAGNIDYDEPRKPGYFKSALTRALIDYERGLKSHRRKFDMAPVSALDTLESKEPDPHHVMNVQLAKRYVSKLPKYYKDTLNLVAEGYSQSQISEITNETLNVVKNRLYTGLKTLTKKSIADGIYASGDTTPKGTGASR